MHKRKHKYKQIYRLPPRNPDALTWADDGAAYWKALFRYFLCWAVIGFSMVWTATEYQFVKERFFPKPPLFIQTVLPGETETAQTAEAEFNRLEKVLSEIAPLERAAEDWYFVNRPAEIRFLGKGSLSVQAEERLGCTVMERGPDKQFFVCANEAYSFFEFSCDKDGCNWILCRNNGANGCRYSIVGTWSGSGPWTRSANVEKGSRKLGNMLYERNGWAVSS